MTAVAFKPQGSTSWVQGMLDKNSSKPVAAEWEGGVP